MEFFKENQYFYINELLNRIERDYSKSSNLKDKIIFYLFGQTGAGKSTIGNAFINGSDTLTRNKKGIYENKDLANILFEIGHSVAS